MAGKREQDLVAAVVQVLQARGHLAWRNNSGRLRDRFGRWVTFGRVGSGDVLAVAAPYGRLVSVEVKLGKNAATPEQVAWARSVEGAGGVAGVVRSLLDLEALAARAEADPAALF